MISKPLFSAIITTYNREPKILERALKSIINQTYSNIEIIIVTKTSNILEATLITPFIYPVIFSTLIYFSKSICAILLIISCAFILTKNESCGKSLIKFPVLLLFPI